MIFVPILILNKCYIMLEQIGFCKLNFLHLLFIIMFNINEHMIPSEEVNFQLPPSNPRIEKGHEKVKAQIKMLQNMNEELERQIQDIHDNPIKIIQPVRLQLNEKIKALIKENEGLKAMMEKERMPRQVQMTKKKTNMQTPGKRSYEEEMPFFEPNVERRHFDSMSMNENQKYEASTCYNYSSNVTENPLQALQPLEGNQIRNRNFLVAEVLQVVERTKRLKEEMSKIMDGDLGRGTQNREVNTSNVRKLEEYKKKLIRLLEKLKIRENNLFQLTAEYKIMYEETVRKLKEANQVLQELQEAEISDNIDDAYAEVLQLEERLTYINEQLQRLDQTKWLEEVYEELKEAIRRIGLNVPKKTEKQSLRDCIDELCEILIECNLSHRNDQNEKINLLKHYHQEEKKNNKQIIQKLKQKEQLLSKKLIQMQMDSQ